MKGDGIKLQMQVSSDCSEDYLRFLKQMGVRYVLVKFADQHTNYEDAARFVDRLRRLGLTPKDGGNVGLHKNPAIHLGLPGRDEAIERYNEFTKILGKIGIPVGYITWEPNRVYTTKWDTGEHTNGARARIVDIAEVLGRPMTHGRVYDEEEIWANFKYFLDRALPVCREAGVRLALHPNDPPVPSVCGIHNLIHSAECYRKAFALADDSPYLGMKLCTGCWLEGGESFGNLLEDLRTFIRQGKVLIVHFRNVSSTLPYFEETLPEDGYMDMTRVMQVLVEEDYQGTVFPDHVPLFEEAYGGRHAAGAYTVGYLKGMLHAIQRAAQQ